MWPFITWQSEYCDNVDNNPVHEKNMKSECFYPKEMFEIIGVSLMLTITPCIQVLKHHVASGKYVISMCFIYDTHIIA